MLSQIMAVSNEMPSCPATGYFYVFTKKSVVLWYLLVCSLLQLQIPGRAIQTAHELSALLPALCVATENGPFPTFCIKGENRWNPSKDL